MKYPLMLLAAAALTYPVMADQIVLTATGTAAYLPNGDPFTIFGEVVNTGDSITFSIEYDDSTPLSFEYYPSTGTFDESYFNAVTRVDILFPSGNLVPVTFNAVGGSDVRVTNDQYNSAESEYHDSYRFSVSDIDGNSIAVDLVDTDGDVLVNESLGFPDATQFETVYMSFFRPDGAGFLNNYDGSANLARASSTGGANTSSDFDGDAIGDIVWHNRVTGELAISLAANTTVGQPLGETILSYVPPAGWYVVGADNFDTDTVTNGGDEIALQYQGSTSGTAPIVFWDVATPVFGAIELTGSFPLALAPPAGWRMVGSGDIDLNGVTDITLQQSPTGEVVSWLFSSPGQPSVGLRPAIQLAPGTGGAEAEWRLADTEDMNGDGNIDFVWQNRLNGQVVIWFLDASLQFVPGGGPLSYQPPSADYLVVDASDRDGDQKADLLLQHVDDFVAHTWFLDGLTVLGGQREPVPAFTLNRSWDIRNSRD